MRHAVERPRPFLERFWGAVVLLLGLSALSGCGKTLQEHAIRKWAHDFCKTAPHRNPSHCDDEVERALPLCMPPFLAKKVTSAQFVQCLGFELPAGAATTPLRVE